MPRLHTMHIAVLGTGRVGRTLAPAFRKLGHDVTVGTRDPDATRRREDWDLDLELVEYGAVAQAADLVVNATSGTSSLSALGMVGTDHLADKVLLDAANPLDTTEGFPPTLAVKDTDSLAEQIQRTFPDTRVVKALNTVNASVMVEPGKVAGGTTTMFLAGDDADARRVVRDLLESLGWSDIIEFEQLSAARGMEMWLPLWIRLMSHLDTAEFNLKIER